MTDPEQLPVALDAAWALDTRALVEQAVVAREIDVAVLRRADGSVFVPPALEILGDGVFDYDAKYGGHADLRVPAPLSETDAKALEDAAVATYAALGCAGVARVDFFLTERRAGPERGQHRPRDDRALPGAADVRGGGMVVRRPPRRAGAGCLSLTSRVVRWPP